MAYVPNSPPWAKGDPNASEEANDAAGGLMSSVRLNHIEEGLQAAAAVADAATPAAPEDNTLYGMYNGAWTNISPVTSTLHVDFETSLEKQDGSIEFPFKTVQAAVNAAGFGDLIMIGPGQSTENVTIAKDNLTIVVEGAEGQYRTKLDGNLTIEADAKRIGITGLEVGGNFVVGANEGLIYADRCDFGSVEYSDTFVGYSKLTSCFIERDSIVNAAQGALVDMDWCQFENAAEITVSSGNLYLIGCRQVNLVHQAGIVVAYGDTQFIADSDGYAIKSSAAANAENALHLLSGATFNGTSYAAIQKSGNCQYSFGIFLHEPNIDILNGTRIDAGMHANDIYAHFTPVNYTPTNDTLLAHLQAIDTRLGEMLPLSGGQLTGPVLVDLPPTDTYGVANLGYVTSRGYASTQELVETGELVLDSEGKPKTMKLVTQWGDELPITITQES